MSFVSYINPLKRNINTITYISYRHFIASKLKCNKFYYVVLSGRNPGIYESWEQCQGEVTGYSNAQFKKFKRKCDVLKYLEQGIAVIKEDPSKISTDVSLLESLFHKYQENWSDITHEVLTDKANVKLNNNFFVDEEGYVVIYTDGACSMNGQKGAAAGIGVYFGPNHPLNASSPVEGKSTGNRAEILAAILALKIAQREGLARVKILTDSQFLVNCTTRWMLKWRMQDWRKRNGDTVENKDDLIQLDECRRLLDVKWVHVPGHMGVKGNEAADALARASIEKN